MTEIRAAIRAYLLTKHPRVFSEEAPDDAEYPYLVFELGTSFGDGESLEVFPVDVDGWDAPEDGDTTLLETLMAAVDGNGKAVNPTGLNKQVLFSDNLMIVMYCENRLLVTDPETRIKRRKYIYQAKIFERS